MSRAKPITDKEKEEIRLGVDKVWLRWILKKEGYARPMTVGDCSGPMGGPEVVRSVKEFNHAREWFLRNLDSDEILATPHVAHWLCPAEPLTGPKARFWFRFYLGRISALEFERVISQALETSKASARLIDLLRCKPLNLRDLCQETEALHQLVSRFSNLSSFRPVCPRGMSPLQHLLMTRWDTSGAEFPELYRLTPASLTTACRKLLGMKGLSDEAVQQCRYRLQLPPCRKKIRRNPRFVH